MKKWIKALGILAAAFAVLVLVLSAAIRIFFPPEKVKSLVEKQMTARLHREVKLGDVSVGLFSGLSISDFKLSEEPDFSKGTFVASERFVVRPRLLPLLAKKVFVKEVELKKPRVTIIRHADGRTYNFSSLISSNTNNAPQTAANPTQNASGPSAIAFLVSKASVQSGKIDFIDRSTAAASVTIDPLNLTIRNFTLAGPVDLQTSLQAKIKGTEIGVDFAGVVGLIKGSAKIKKCLVTNGPSKISVGGEVRDLMDKEPAYDLKVTLENLEPSFINAFASLPPSLKLQGPIVGDCSLQGTQAALAFNTRLNFTQAGVSSPGTFVKPAGTPMELKAAGDVKDLKNVALKDLKLSLASFNLSGNGIITNAADPNRQMQLALQTNQFPVTELLKFLPAAALPKDAKISGASQLSAAIDGTSDAGKMKMQADATALEIQYGKAFKKPSGVPMQLQTSGNYSMPLFLDLKDLRVSLSQMELSGTGVYKPMGEKSSYAFNMKTNDFPLEDVSKWVPPMQEFALIGKTSVTMKVASAPQGPDVKGTAVLSNVASSVAQAKISNVASTVNFTMKDTSGKLTADQLKHEFFSGQKLDVKWNLTDAADLGRISGTANLHQGSGEFQNIRKLTSDSKAARILFLPLTLLQKFSKATGGVVKIPSLDNVSFKEIVGDYVFKSGVMNITKFDLNGTDLSTTMKGTVGLAGVQPVDVKAQLKLAAGLVEGALGEALQDEQGRTTLNLTVKGTATDPQVSVDAQNTGKQIINAVKEKLGDHPEEKVKDLLKGLFNK